MIKKITSFHFYYYDINNIEKVITWKDKEGYSHEFVDCGEGRTLSYKMNPILIPGCDFNVALISQKFLNKVNLLMRGYLLLFMKS